jgi:hypothetical protein
MRIPLPKQIQWQPTKFLKAQLDRYENLENDMKSLSEFTTRKKSVDFAGFIGLNKDGKRNFYFRKTQRSKSRGSA